MTRSGAVALVASSVSLTGLSLSVPAQAGPPDQFERLTQVAGSPQDLTAVGSTLFFTADNGANGRELWTSDGTPAGTSQLADINPGPADSSPDKLIDIDGTLYFTADNGTNGRELWTSDGTLAGTRQIADINPGPGSSLPGYPAKVAGNLYFRASDASSGAELWTTDGTSAGTTRIADINAGPNGSFPYYLTDVGGTLFFSATNGPANGNELWTSDGTAAGTVQVADIRPGTPGGFPYLLTEFAGSLYFTATNGINGRELWTSDGSPAGTRQIADINPGSSSSKPTRLTRVAGTLFFSATNGANGYELWKSDGTTGGTKQVADINPNPDPSAVNGSYPVFLTDVAGTLYFSASNSEDGVELWTSDGSTAGTVQVANINPTPRPSYVRDGLPLYLTDVGGTLIFTAMDGTTGFEPWTSDGTSGGTRQLIDLQPGAGDSNPNEFVGVGGKLFFRGDDGVNGPQLWRGEDTIAPDTTIITGPAEGSSLRVNTATFGFVGTPGDTAGFQCSLDAAAFTPCTSPMTVGELSSGSHTFAVRAVDSAGSVDATPAMRTFRVSTAATRPSNEFKLAKRVKTITKNGRIKITLTLPGPGKVTVKGKKSPIKKTTKTIKRAGKTKITVKPTKAGLKKLRRQVNKNNTKVAKLKITLRVQYTPTGGTKNVKTAKYKLKLRR